MIDLFLIIFLVGFMTEDYLSSIKNNGVGRISLLPLIFLFVVALYFNYQYVEYGVGYLLFWIINNISISFIFKRKLSTLMGLGDYPIIFIVGLIMHDTISLLFIVMFNAILYILIFSNKRVKNPFLPSFTTSFILVYLFNLILSKSSFLF